MVTKKKTAGPKKTAGKLKLKKETIRDLDAKGKSSEVKGGQARGDRIFIPTRGRAPC